MLSRSQGAVDAGEVLSVTGEKGCNELGGQHREVPLPIASQELFDKKDVSGENKVISHWEASFREIPLKQTERVLRST